MTLIILLLSTAFGSSLMFGRIRGFMRSIFTVSHDPVSGTPVTPSDAPKLWELVEQVARNCSFPVPDRIVLGFDDAGFYVTSGVFNAPNRDGTEKDEILLYLYVPLLLVMSEDELCSVIGHELGHVNGEDLEYRHKFSRIFLSACQSIETLAGEDYDPLAQAALGTAMKLGEFFLHSFLLADMCWSRRRELAADLAGARAVSAEASALALARIGMYMPCFLDAVGKRRLLGSGAGTGIIQGLKDALAEYSPAPLGVILESSVPHPMDSHPCLRERLANLGVEADEELEKKAANLNPGALLARLGI